MANSEIPEFEKGCVIFLIAGMELAINVKTLYRIINPLEDLSIENSINIEKNFLVIDHEEIPFINLYELYKVGSPVHSEDIRIITVHNEEYKSAFYVEKVKEFISLNTKNFFPSEFISITDRPFIKGKLLFNDRSVFIPDFDRILAEV